MTSLAVLQPQHADGPLAQQAVGRVGPQTGGVFRGGQLVEASQAADLPPERAPAALVHRPGEPEHRAVRGRLPPQQERPAGRERLGTTARPLGLRRAPNVSSNVFNIPVEKREKKSIAHNVNLSHAGVSHFLLVLLFCF